MKQVLSTVEHGAQQKGDTGKEFVNTGDRGHEREKEKKKHWKVIILTSSVIHMYIILFSHI